jgi:hypothetical protein
VAIRIEGPRGVRWIDRGSRTLAGTLRVGWVMWRESGPEDDDPVCETEEEAVDWAREILGVPPPPTQRSR